MDEVYEETALTPLRAARLVGYLDWASQPATFKHYPDFLFRYSFLEDFFQTNPHLKIIQLSRSITSRNTRGGKPYYQLTVPSAGNLHPIELYVQIRGINGILSGIYHVDSSAESLVLIREINGEGIEPMVGLEKRFVGMLFIVASVPFRSEWKYGKRALRYCYLDAGHQVGALCQAAALAGQNATIVSGIDRKNLDTMMGFLDDEFSCAVLAVGYQGSKEAEPLKSPLMKVSPLNYSETSGYTISHTGGDTDNFGRELRQDNNMVSHIADKQSVLERRSARQFGTESMKAEYFEALIQLCRKAPYPLVCYSIVMSGNHAPPGIYTDGGCIKEGLFAKKVSALLVDQRFIGNAEIVAILTAQKFRVDALMVAGIFVHRLCLDAQAYGIGCTGIGAFYDHKIEDFLGTSNAIVYVAAFGQGK